MIVPNVVLGGVAIGVVLIFWNGSKVRRDLSSRLRSAHDDTQRLENANVEALSRFRTANEHIHELEEKKLRWERHAAEQAKILAEKSAVMPWLAEMVADANWLRDEREARFLEGKKHPAASAAEQVRQHGKEKRELRLQKRLTEYRVSLYENLFPWLRDIAFSDAEEIAEAARREVGDRDDPAAAWLSADEWASLSASERYQRALDRYKRRRKSNWEIGRDFERYIGYQWEAKGADVTYHGAIKGFEDFGRDLIVKEQSGKILLLQCKYWSRDKIIPEAVVFQLLGSTMSFYLETTGKVPPDLATLIQFVEPYLVTSASLEPRIREIGEALGMKIMDRLKMDEWPMVKCNIAADGERIYHLPMDQMYDRVKLVKLGEMYVPTILAAEAKGFRRAKRWFGNTAA